MLAAVAEGKISLSRHGSYLMLYEEAMQVPDWQREESRK